MIRKATIEDISRIAEILVFVKRMNYRSIFNDDSVSFGEIQVLSVAKEYSDPELLNDIWVYEADGIVKGLIRIVDREIVELYVEHFFQGQGIGAELIEFAKKSTMQIVFGCLKRIHLRSGFIRLTALMSLIPNSLKRVRLNIRCGW